jgi:hypothetical protein
LGAIPTLGVELGQVSSAGAFSVLGSSLVPTAVRVTASSSIDFAFGFGDRGGVSRQAVATANPGACWKLGSTALDLNTGNSVLLNAILGDALNVTAVSYSGLSGLGLKVGDLATALGVGSTDALLGTTVTYDQFLAAAATALQNDGDPTNNSGIAILNATVAGTTGSIASAPINVGQLIGIGAGDNSALSSKLDVLGLVKGGAFVANGNNFLAIPNLSLTGLPVGATAQLFITEPPQQACNSGLAETAQVRVVITVPVSIGITLPGIIPIQLGVATGNVTTTLDLAKASGRITQVNCINGVATGLAVSLDQVAVASLSTSFDVRLLGLPLVRGAVPGDVPVQGSAGPYTLDLPDKYANPLKTPPGGGQIGLPKLSSAQVSVAGIPLLGSGLALDLTSGVIDPVLATVSGLLTGPISTILGLRLGGADMFAVPNAECLNPKVVG